VPAHVRIGERNTPKLHQISDFLPCNFSINYRPIRVKRRLYYLPKGFCNIYFGEGWLDDWMIRLLACPPLFAGLLVTCCC